MSVELFLKQGLGNLQSTLPLRLNTAEVQAQLVHYLEELARWNRVYSLTAVSDLEAAVTRHILDSLSILPFLKGSTWADLGTGPGLPGIPLALAVETATVFLVESRRKKVQFLEHVVHQLGLSDRVVVVHSRVEEWEPSCPIHTLVARAWGSLAHMGDVARRLKTAETILVAMKGRYPAVELAELEQASQSLWRLEAVYPIEVPGLEEQRHAVVLK